MLEPVPGWTDASIEEDDEYILPVNVSSVPAPDKTELMRTPKDSMPEDVTIVSESGDDRPLINLATLSTKKLDDEKGDRVHRETTAFTDMLRVNPVPERSPPPATPILSTGQKSLVNVKSLEAEKILVIHKRKKLGKESQVITEPSQSTRVSAQSSNKGCPDDVTREQKNSESDRYASRKH